MSRQSEIDRIAKLLWKLDFDEYDFEQYLNDECECSYKYDSCCLHCETKHIIENATKLVDNGIGTKDRFEIDKIKLHNCICGDVEHSIDDCEEANKMVECAVNKDVIKPIDYKDRNTDLGMCGMGLDDKEK